jgi:hypothetical protein
MRTAEVLRAELLQHSGVVVTDVPYRLSQGPAGKGRGAA